jgi:hypothetical protein
MLASYLRENVKQMEDAWPQSNPARDLPETLCIYRPSSQ